MQLSFEPIRVEHQADYRRRLGQCAQIASDYSFANLFGWGPEYGLEWAWDGDLVWIRQGLPFPVLWAPVGDWNKIDWVARASTMASLADRVIRVPESLVRIWRAVLPDAGFQTKESRGQWDYLYKIEELVNLKGNRFHKKKNLVNQFKKAYRFDYLTFGEQMVQQALAMQEDWCTWRDCENHATLAAENKAIERILMQWQGIEGIIGGALRVQGQLVAYTIAERMPDRSVVIHFEKGNPEFKGSYQAINQLFLANLSPGAEIVNREQDLDDEGLRKAKLSYNPFDFIKKFEVTLRAFTAYP